MTCKICNSRTRSLLVPNFEITYYKCDQCQYISMDGSKKVTFKEERHLYDRHENSIENEGYVNMFKNFLDTGVLPFKSSGSLLDYGSGPEPVLIEIIKRDYTFSTDHYDPHYAPEKKFENKPYDVIVSTEVIEHVDDPVTFMKTLSDLLTSGGILSIMTLFHSNKDAEFLKWWYHRDETHISFFTEKTLRVLAHMTSMEIIYTDGKRITSFRKMT